MLSTHPTCAKQAFLFDVVHDIDVLLPLLGWLIEGLETSSLATGNDGNDDRWYTIPSPLCLPKGHCWSTISRTGNVSELPWRRGLRMDRLGLSPARWSLEGSNSQPTLGALLRTCGSTCAAYRFGKNSWLVVTGTGLNYEFPFSWE